MMKLKIALIILVGTVLLAGCGRKKNTKNEPHPNLVLIFPDRDIFSTNADVIWSFYIY